MIIRLNSQIATSDDHSDSTNSATSLIQASVSTYLAPSPGDATYTRMAAVQFVGGQSRRQIAASKNQ